MLSETNNLGRPEGYYKHKETGAIVKLAADAALGTPMIDAFIQAGYVHIDESEVPKVEVETEKTVEVAEPTNKELVDMLVGFGAEEKVVKKFNKAQLKEELAKYEQK